MCLPTGLASLPAAVPVKKRLSVPPSGIDVFEPPLHGSVLAEVEITGDDEVRAFVPSPECLAEVTDDARFTGGKLVRASRSEVLAGPADRGIRPGSS
ncbi:hypothetical protein OG763_40440 [Streptomyces sp. NBC_01230]|uniref:hypothetical protein n=1 Tax=unclassified Streptomyces TaxID=2593676 RepID=UPI002E1122E1|nr:hypothetical protein OG763_40440 [Streptomyces sp. NBC_01230]